MYSLWDPACFAYLFISISSLFSWSICANRRNRSVAVLFLFNQAVTLVLLTIKTLVIMKKKPKLSLKKIIVSNLADAVAKKVYGGDDATTYGENCTKSCNEACTASKGDTKPGCDTMGCP